MDYKTLGLNIRSERKKQNMTIEDLAFKADITPNYLGKIERAQSKLSLEALVKIANALNITADDLLYHEFTSIPSKKINKLNNQLNTISKNKDYYELLEVIINHLDQKK